MVYLVVVVIIDKERAMKAKIIDPSEIDWEQRRYEIAKDILAGYASNSSDRIMNANVLDQIETSIKIADVLIDKLKGGEE